MTKIHKDIAMHLMECAEDEEFTDQAVVKVLCRTMCVSLYIPLLKQRLQQFSQLATWSFK